MDKSIEWKRKLGGLFYKGSSGPPIIPNNWIHKVTLTMVS